MQSNFTAFELSGETDYLTALAHIFHSSEPSIYQMSEYGSILRSNDFLLGTEHDSENEAKAAYCVSLINGATRLAIGRIPQIGLWSLIHLNGNTLVRRKFLYRHIVVHSDQHICDCSQASADEELTGLLKPVSSWVAIANNNSTAARVLQFLGKESLDWRSLYPLLEAVTETFTQKQIINEGWASKSELELFKRTINNSNAIGIEARHTSSVHPAPANPMEYNRARCLVETIARNWLNMQG